MYFRDAHTLSPPELLITIVCPSSNSIRAGIIVSLPPEINVYPNGKPSKHILLEPAQSNPQLTE